MKKTILTDIEGTTSSISFVKDVLFPYARKALPEFVRRHGGELEVRHWLDAAAVDAGSVCSDDVLIEVLQGWIDSDRKHPALKALQGMIWKSGYEDGEYTAHIYPDAAAALRAWHAGGHALFVYSSGSVPAQKLLFGHSDAGDLRPLFSGYFDTDVGGKRDARSYRNILDALRLSGEQILFLSDVVEELDAAREAGLDTVLLDRREDYPAPRLGEACHGHARVTSFADIDV
ncbi:MAG TPA: acireductone synthase [Arenimonas sp.]|uniref:acireductone synthase n=1 Tax=Arenimonas sp. TaxID=1872635 RepID=UPI002D10FFBA|nr:acireductone synthase [Arenimonas sp.]HMB56124.1 acireductone synthase [Arenimonas sp.]